MSLTQRVKNRAERDVERHVLNYLRRRADGDVFVDYGWGSLIYTGDGDAQEVKYHLKAAEWRRQAIADFGPLVSPGDTVVDVGANLGLLSLILASLVGPGGRVIALEPSARTFAKLERTIERNGLSEVVTALNAGCGAEPGAVTLHQVGASSGNASIVGGDGPGEEVALIRLDDLELPSDVALVKIDTEGFESQVLHGGARLLAEQRPTIYIELGGHYLESTLEAIALLEELGYETGPLRQVEWASVGNGANFVVKPRP